MLDQNESFDLAVIGAGSAGFSASITAAELGARVALIGQGTIGGTCVNVGCVPSKALIRAAESLHYGTTATRFAGIHGRLHLDDWSALAAQKDELVRELRQAKYIDLLPSYNNVAYMDGPARLTENGVAINGQAFRSEKIVIATGSSASIPPISGIEDVPYLTSTAALELEQLPKSMTVIGAGYIGCELAQMFARFGVKVTVLCRSRLLPETEPEISDALASYFGDEDILVRDGVSYQAVRRTPRGIAVDLAADGAEESIEAEMLLVATGRQPHSDDLDLQVAGVELDSKGGIPVNDWMQTSNPSVYAAGDVTGRDQFVYMAAYGAKLAAKNAIEGNTQRYDATAMPVVTFTDPQVAGVGLTEAAARSQGLAVKTSVLSLAHVPRALAARDTRGLIKLIADKETDRLLGAHILAPEGCDSIQTAALAIKQGMTTVELAATIFPYLTTVEGLKLAAQTFDKDVAKLSCCAG